MSFADRVRALAAELPDELGRATSQPAALVLPFVTALGYDTSNLGAVSADHLPPFLREGRQPDFTVSAGPDLTLVFMVLAPNETLTEQDGDQLKAHLSLAFGKRIGVLTNGVRYELYGDLVALNESKPVLLMLNEPFLVVDMLALNDDVVGKLGHLAKDQLDLKAMLDGVDHLDDVRRRVSKGRSVDSLTDDVGKVARWTSRVAVLARVVWRAYAEKDAPADVVAWLCQLCDLAARISSAECKRFGLARAMDKLAGEVAKAPAELGLDKLPPEQAALLRDDLALLNDALSQDLATGNSAMAASVRERDELEREFEAAYDALLRCLNDNPECRELVAAELEAAPH